MDIEANANVLANVEESLVDSIPEDDDDWNFRGAVGLDKVECVGINQGF